MSTLSAIQRLSDGEFHRLGDELLRRIDPRYRQLRTFGLNEREESIVGQPDSYVGDSPDLCTIAVQYTVKRQDWWRKVIDDVEAAVKVSAVLQEVVVVIPRNKDRDGPARKGNDWLTEAKAAAHGASFRLVDGYEITQLLDNDHQDLRHRHLGIPYSRLNEKKWRKKMGSDSNY